MYDDRYAADRRGGGACGTYALLLRVVPGWYGRRARALSGAAAGDSGGGYHTIWVDALRYSVYMPVALSAQ